MQRPVVVLPLPDSPTRPNVSPASMVKLTPSTARHDRGLTKQPLASNEMLDERADFEQRRQAVQPSAPGRRARELGWMCAGAYR